MHFNRVYEHLINANKRDDNILSHLAKTIRNPAYQKGFMTTSLLSLGGFMLMPYATIFAVNNLSVHEDQLPILFMVSGIVSLLLMPLIGKMSDRIDKLKLFGIGCIWLVVFCVIYTNLNNVSFMMVLVFNTCITIGVLARMVPSMALLSAVPDHNDRGAYMSIQSSIQQISGGIAASVAGLIVYQKTPSSPLERYNTVGYVVALCVIGTLFMMMAVSRYVKSKPKEN